MIQKIKIACDEQGRGSEQIVIAVEDIQQSTNINLEAIGILNDALESLQTADGDPEPGNKCFQGLMDKPLSRNLSLAAGN